ncbi:MAG: glucose 1-dehydrogenase [Chloroflexi bacterium]|nr:glucose 1-dehydrogenase [Chloroflexota bacterium]MBV9134787.1 glucose 1-dehydrogenase [Chloroflexota bacterium]MBV9897769.1 glucose 1-dehydrogenase [Chloroflexota bacterium]
MARFQLNEKIVLVTGGGSGIGAAICRATAEQGARVVVAELDANRGRQVVADLGDTAMFQQTDVTDLASVQNAVAIAAQRFGRLDVLVNCAGIGHVGSVQETEPADFDRLMAVNVRGVYHGSRAAVDQMLAQDPKGGVIINIASVAGQIGVPRRFAYCATKGAVIAMTRQLAVDYVKEGIRCNAICPGTVYSPFVEGYVERFHHDTREQTIAELHARQPIGRMGRPDEIADLTVYLASDEAGFMTGSAVVIDGAWTAT